MDRFGLGHFGSWAVLVVSPAQAQLWSVYTAFEKYSGSLLFTGLSTTSIKALWPGHTAKLNTTYDGS